MTFSWRYWLLKQKQSNVNDNKNHYVWYTISTTRAHGEQSEHLVCIVCFQTKTDGYHLSKIVHEAFHHNDELDYI